MNKKMIFTTGTDPELMIKERKTGKIISALRVLKNDKYDPVDLGNGMYSYADNILLEAKCPPTNSKQEFIEMYRQMFSGMKNMIGNEYELVPLASHIYDESELKDKRAWEIGCVANFNCYTESVNPTVEFENGLRTGSNHIHLGNKKLCKFNTRHEAIKLLDIFLGCSSVIFDKEVEASRARRKYYGGAGEMRPSRFGLEFRVLSPFCLKNPALVDLVYDLVDYAMSFIESDTQMEILNSVNLEEVQKAINNCDLDLARKVLDVAGLPQELRDRVEAQYDTADFYKNWNI